MAGSPPGNGICFTGASARTSKKYRPGMCDPEPTPADPMRPSGFRFLDEFGQGLIGDLTLAESNSGADTGSERASKASAVCRDLAPFVDVSDVVATRMV